MMRSRKKFSKSIALFLLILLMLFSLINVNLPNALSQSNSNNIDLVLIIDQSNSMFTESDMKGLRFEAAKIAIDMLSMDKPDTKSQVGLVIFGDPGKAEEVFPLTSISDPTKVNAMKDKIDKIEHKDLWNTDIKNGLDVAYQTMENNHIATNKPVFVIITDGQPYLGKKWAEEGKEKPYLQDIMDNTIPKFKSKKWPIFTLALGMDAIKSDSEKKFYKNFWNDLSTYTNGLYFEATKEENLVSEFLQILSLLTNKNTDVSTINVQNETTKEWKINPNFVQSLSFVFLKNSPNSTMTIIRPNGEEVSKSSKGAYYSQNGKSIVYKIPVLPSDVDSGSAAGTWKAIIKGNSTVTIALVLNSDLKLVIDNPSAGQLIPVDSPFRIKAHFTFKGEPISTENLHPKIAATISKSNNIVKTVELFDDGEHQDGRSSNGYFGSDNIVLDQIGDYQLKVDSSIYSSSINTVQSLVVHNIPSIKISVSPENPIIGQTVKITAQFVFKNPSEEQDLIKNSTPILVSIVTPDNSTKLLSGVKNSDGSYVFQYTPEAVGKFIVTAESKVYGSPVKQSSTFNSSAKIDLALNVNKTEFIQGSDINADLLIKNINDLPDTLVKSLSVRAILTLPNGGSEPISNVPSLQNGELKFVIPSDDFKMTGKYVLNCTVAGPGNIEAQKTTVLSVKPESIDVNVANEIVSVKVNDKNYSYIPITFSNVQLSQPAQIMINVSSIYGDKDGLKIPLKALKIEEGTDIVKISPNSKPMVQKVGISLSNKNYKIKPGIYNIEFNFSSNPDTIKVNIINAKTKLTVHVPLSLTFYLIILLLLILGGAGAYYYFTKVNVPKLSGEIVRLDSKGKETEDVYDLYNKSVFTIGNKGGADLIVDAETKKPSVLSIIKPTGTKKDSKQLIKKLSDDIELLINGDPVDEKILNDGDMIEIGNEKFKFRDLSEFGVEEEEFGLGGSEDLDDLFEEKKKDTNKKTDKDGDEDDFEL